MPGRKPIVVESSDSVRIAVHDLGGTGPPVLFAHATGFCGPVWGPVADHLPDYRCWALDFRCHGRSTRPSSGDLSWSGTADDALAAIDAVGGDGWFGVGHSMGGAALLLAEQRQPGAFRGLWCFEPVVFPPAFVGIDDSDNPLALGAARRREVFESFDAARGTLAAKPPLYVFDAASLSAYVEGGFAQQSDGSVRLSCSAADESAFYLMGPHHDAFEHLGEVTCPVTIARGRPEPGPASVAPVITSALPAGRLVEMPSVGHFGPMEHPAAVASAIRAATALDVRPTT